MKPLFICDTSSSLSKTLIDQYQIYQINISKSFKGQVMYEIDKAINKTTEIIYLSTKEHYDDVNTICQKILNFHQAKITLINIDSSTLFGKNNLVLRLVSSKNLESDLINYQVEHKELSNNLYYEIGSDKYSYCFGQYQDIINISKSYKINAQYQNKNDALDSLVNNILSLCKKENVVVIDCLDENDDVDYVKKEILKRNKCKDVLINIINNIKGCYCPSALVLSVR